MSNTPHVINNFLCPQRPVVSLLLVICSSLTAVLQTLITEDTVYLALRGSHTNLMSDFWHVIHDWTSNLNCSEEPVPWLQIHAQQLKLHKGFATCGTDLICTPLFDQLLQQADGKRLVLTGHSRGGALATVLFLYLMASDHTDGPSPTSPTAVECITFAAPLLATQQVGHWLQQIGAADSLLNISHAHDIVPVLQSSFGHHCLRMLLQAIDRISREVPLQLGPLANGVHCNFSPIGTNVMFGVHASEQMIELPINEEISTGCEYDEYKYSVYDDCEYAQGQRHILLEQYIAKFCDELAATALEDVLAFCRSDESSLYNPHRLETMQRYVKMLVSTKLREFTSFCAKDCFQQLGKSVHMYQDISDNDISRASRLAIKKFHPDKRNASIRACPASMAMYDSMMLHVLAAHAVLRTADRREAYVRALRARQHNRRAQSRVRAEFVATDAQSRAQRAGISWPANAIPYTRPQAPPRAALTAPNAQPTVSTPGPNHHFNTKAGLLRVVRNERTVFIRPENLRATDVPKATQQYTEAVASQRRAAAAQADAGVAKSAGSQTASSGFKSIAAQLGKAALFAAAAGAVFGAISSGTCAARHCSSLSAMETIVKTRLKIGHIKRMLQCSGKGIPTYAQADINRLRSMAIDHFKLSFASRAWHFTKETVSGTARGGAMGALRLVSLGAADGLYERWSVGKAEQEGKISKAEAGVLKTRANAKTVTGLGVTIGTSLLYMFTGPVGWITGAGLLLGSTAAVVGAQKITEACTQPELDKAKQKRVFGRMFDSLLTYYSSESAQEERLYVLDRCLHLDAVIEAVNEGLTDHCASQVQGHAVISDVKAAFIGRMGDSGFISRQSFIDTLRAQWRTGQADRRTRELNRKQRQLHLTDKAAPLLLTDESDSNANVPDPMSYTPWQACIAILGLCEAEYPDAKEKFCKQALGDYGLECNEIISIDRKFGKSEAEAIEQISLAYLDDISMELDQHAICRILCPKQLTRLLEDKGVIVNPHSGVNELQKQLLKAAQVPYVPLLTRVQSLLLIKNDDEFPDT